MSSIYKISVDAVHEVIEGEAIIINMATGSYYNLEGSGSLIWEMLQKGPSSAAALAQAIKPLFNTEITNIEKAAKTLLEELAAEGLLSAAEQAGEIENLSGDASREFETPVLNKYTDLEALLLIDPIHDVTSEGWPHTPGQPSS